MCFFLKDTLSLLIAVCMYMDVRLSNRAWIASQGLHPWRKSIYPPPETYSCCLAVGGASWPHPLSVLGLLLVWSCTHSHSPCEFICATPLSCLIKAVLLPMFTTLALAIFFCPLSMVSPEPWDRTENIDVSFTTEHSTVSFSPHHNQLWVSLLIIIYYQRKSLWGRTRGRLLYE